MHIKSIRAQCWGLGGCLGVFLLCATLQSPDAHAQMMGHNLLGDFGLQSATQPDPGWYVGAMYYLYTADKVHDKDGDALTFSEGNDNDLNLHGFGAYAWWVSPYKIAGANYSALIGIGGATATIEAPYLGIDSNTGVGFADIYVQPINLGWHLPFADFMAGFGVFAPTGRYDSGADDNTGLGMWTFELLAGTTIYFDKRRSWHLATTAYYEFHTDKQDSDARVGQILSLEGGAGKSFLDGAIIVGAAYYAQFKITDDDFGLDMVPPGDFSIGKHRVFGIGPEASVPIATRKKLYAMLTARYLWEVGARSHADGNTLTVLLTFPIPPISTGGAEGSTVD